MTKQVRFAILAFLVASAVLVVAMEFGGGAPSTPPPGIPDPGRLVSWGVPVAKLATDAMAVFTIGFLTLAAFLLPSPSNEAEGLAVRAVRIASATAFLWAAATLVLYTLTVADVFAAPLGDLSVALVTSLASDSSFGRAILLQALGAAVVAISLRWTLNAGSLAIILGIAGATLIPVSLTGHAAGSGGHDLATVSILLHLVGVTLWVGGLAALAWVALRGSKRLEDAVTRYSTMAAWCFAIVAVSGAINAAVRLGSWSALFGSDYGLLVVGKLVALASLGLFGWRHRQRLIARGSGFLRLATSELLVMASAIGLAVALSRTPTPVPDDLLQTAVEELLGGPIPPPPDAWGLITGWSGNGIGLAVVGLGVAFYLTGVLALKRRGDSWPIGRSLAWAAGMAIVAWATFGGLGEYSHVLFSAHMVSHMMLSMVAPIFLVLAAPITLALRTLPGPRQPGELSPRAMLTKALHSRPARFFTHPLVGPVLFVGSLYGLYFTPAFAYLMDSHTGHSLMVLHFLGVGCLYYYVLIGVDPSPRALAPPVRFGMLLVTIPFHAFFSIAVMSSTTVLAKPYWEFLDRPYRQDLLADQYLGGSISWAMGEVPLLLVMIALLVQWFSSDQREARRFDRNEDRNDDAELQAYNARLADLAAHGKRRDPGGIPPPGAAE